MLYIGIVSFYLSISVEIATPERDEKSPAREWKQNVNALALPPKRGHMLIAMGEAHG